MLLRYTLLGDGGSDQILGYPIDWLLRNHYGGDGLEVLPRFAHPAQLPGAPRSLPEKVKAALHQGPCDVLFVHRDAEAQAPELRAKEIAEAVRGSASLHVPVVPVRMTETWLLIEEEAIRRAAGNPNGTAALHLPKVRDLEKVLDPKRALHEALLTAAEASGRRRKRLKARLAQSVHRVGALIEDFSPLRELPAFSSFEEHTLRVISNWRASLTSR